MSLEVQVIITLIHISLLTLEDLSIAKCMFLLYGEKFQFNWKLFLKMVSNWIILRLWARNAFAHVLATLLIGVYGFFSFASGTIWCYFRKCGPVVLCHVYVA